MPVTAGREGTFNHAAEAYAQWRPGYVSALYDDVFAYRPIDAACAVLEIGIGAGQATGPFLETGCALTAVELGGRLAAIAARTFSRYPRFAVVNTSFQAYDGPDAAYDLVYAASSFHWIPEDIGYPKVYRLLKPGGAFARFACHPDYQTGQEALYADMQRVYAQYMPDSAPAPVFRADDAKARADIGCTYGFVEPRYVLYQRKRVYRAQEYVALLHTYSDHIALEESRQPGFYAGIRAAIERHGGQITLTDTIDLELVRKP